MTSLIAQILPSIEQLGFWGYWLVFLSSFGESLIFTGFFVPGTVILIATGALVSEGYYTFRDMFLFSMWGAVMGDAISFELGRMGRVHVERWPRIQSSVQRGKKFFHRYKELSVFIGRFLGPIRPIISFVAGVLDMPRWRFYVANVLSAIVWSLGYLFLGYTFGLAWKSAIGWSSTVIGSAVGALILFALLYAAFRWLRAKFLKKRNPIIPL